MGQDVNIDHVSMQFGPFYAIKDFNVHIRSGEFFSFLGPSGCGKTTLLRLISGFIDPTQGEIRIGGRNMRGIGPNKRATAMIFQNLALFPLMTVADNIAFGLEIRKVSRVQRMQKVNELLELVELPDAADKKVNDLSGGQMQRVAIARALAVEPAVLLLDEPLSALDLKLRKHMRSELRKIQRRTGVTFIYITHDQGEALTMSDRIGVMSIGRLEQVGEPHRVYNQPETAFVASFVGENNMFRGQIDRVQNGSAIITTSSGLIQCRNPKGLGTGELTTAFVRPETINIANGNNGDANVLECQVTAKHFEGAYANIGLEAAGGQHLIMRLNNDGSTSQIEKGSLLKVAFSPANTLLLSGGEYSDG
jgi:spermidine/putrescine transport system ATP-binding protein